jgi:hypothetical protein
MNQRKWLWVTLPLLGVFTVGVIGYTLLTSAHAEGNPPVGQAGKQADVLPIKQVVLFNSGVGYFQREGEIDGNARVQLSFPVSDINDLLKSLVLQDSKGEIGTVSYDSSDPIDKILRSFALDLTGNPTFGQILNQARGESIEITQKPRSDIRLVGDDNKGATTKLKGKIIGLEVQHKPAGKDQIIPIEILNLNTAAGLQAIPMNEVVSVRFMNPTLETEFNRALNVLATSHDTQKKTVSVGFNGDGKRQVRVGYVVERPIWKTSYRLRIDNKGKVFLQGWALVENTSDDDWNDVRMVLVSGKPISFKMNLYDPIYIPRPFVEPEMFASLRPPVYQGSMSLEEMKRLAVGGNQALLAGDLVTPRATGGVATNGLPVTTGVVTMPSLPPVYNAIRGEDVFAQQNLTASGQGANTFNSTQPGNSAKLTYDEMQRRKAESQVRNKDAAKIGESLTGFNFKEGIKSVATADEVGDYFQYTIKQDVTLARQKSAMLPILDQTIEGQKVSIFNESVHAKFPLLGVKLKNTSGQPLTQGPITVYDGGVFGGDTRILDVQPGEERLLSYALDQGTEVKTETKQTPSPSMTFRIGSDQLSARYFIRETKTYTLKNRSTHARDVILEHPIRKDWKLTDPKKAIEQTRDLYRFQVSVPAGQVVSYEVVEDLPRVDNFGPQPSYSITAGINVKVENHTDLHKLTGMKIVKGFLQLSHKTRETKAYFVQNLSDVDRNFTVDHVVRPGWSRLDDKNDPQAGPEVFRFKLEIAKGKTGKQSVREERNFTDAGTLIKNLSESQIRNFMIQSAASADVKAALTKAVAMQTKIHGTQSEITEIEKQLAIVTADHNRVRENLKIVPQTSEHYKAFLEKFVAQDKQIEAFQKNVRELNTTMQAQIREYDQYLAKLDAE